MSISSSFFSTKLPFGLISKTPISKVPFGKILFPGKPNTLKPSITITKSSTSTRSSIQPITESFTITESPVQPIEDLPPKLQEIIYHFQSISDFRYRYKELLSYIETLPPFNPKFRTENNWVPGCNDNVYVRAFLDSENNLQFEADSDSNVVKGLLAILVEGLSGQPIEEILNVSPDFITLLRLHQALPTLRNDGFENILKFMQKKAWEAHTGAEEGGGKTESETHDWSIEDLNWDRIGNGGASEQGEEEEISTLDDDLKVEDDLCDDEPPLWLEDLRRGFHALSILPNMPSEISETWPSEIAESLPTETDEIESMGEGII